MSWLRALFFLSVFSAAAVYRTLQDPRPLVVDSPRDTDFSAVRALSHLKVIAREPHPVGSRENQRVREYIQKKLTEYGVAHEVQKSEIARTFLPRVHRAGRVENIVAHLPGETENYFLFTAHYDSVGTGPGAADDGTAVAAFLETIRILSKDTRRQNTLIFLFTDGEEAGLLGASAFARKDLSPVRAVFDFEARGISGPSILFQTGANSGGLLRLYFDHAERPYAASLGTALYDLLPNDTDFSVFKQRGIPGLDFAFIGGVEYYHTLRDSPDQVELRTIQHHGENVLSLARAAQSASTADLEGGDLVFFYLWPGTVLRYPAWFARLLAAAALVWTAVLVSRAARDPESRMFSVLWRFAVAAAGAVAAGVLLFRMVRWLSGAADSVLGQPFNPVQYSCLFAFFILSVVHLLRKWLRGLSAESTAAAAQAVLAVLLAAGTVLLPGLSYIFLWPLFGSLFAAAVPFRFKGILPVLFAVPAFVFAVDVSAYIMAGLTVKAGMLAAPYVILLALSQEPFLRRNLAGGTLVVKGFAFGGLVLSALLVLWTARKGPMINSLAYGFEEETNKAFYFTCASRDDSYTSRFFAEAVRADVLPPFPVMKRCLDGEMFRLSSAPRRAHQLPEVRVVREERSGGRRTLDLEIKSPRGASQLIISVKHDQSLFGIHLAGEDLPLGLSGGAGKQGLHLLKRYLDLENWHTIIYSGLSGQGVRLQIEQRQETPLPPIELRITDMSRTIEDNVTGRRPSGALQQPEFPFSDGVFLIRRLKL